MLADLSCPGPGRKGLLERYRPARYSHHLLDEGDRAVAMAALQRDPRGDRRSTGMSERRTVVVAVLARRRVRVVGDVRRRGRRLVA